MLPFLALAGLALEAYDRYVDHQEKKNITEEDGLSEQEIQDLLTIRVELANIMVSLWSHACDADEEFQDSEKEVVQEMIDSLFTDDSLFPEEIANQDVIMNELLETFENPLPMKSILKYAKDDDELLADLYSQACCILIADKSLTTEEREFLDNLAKDFGLSDFDKKSIEKKYLKVT